MTGYTPLFGSVFEGTLCGRWPDTGIWTCLLALSDRHGNIDVTPQYISAVTGVPIDELMACLERFMSPDPQSRTPDEQGRRLVKLDDNRKWGWKIVNHGKYREKARLVGKNAREVEQGKNKDRMADRRRPPPTAGDPPSEAEADLNTDTEIDSAHARSRPKRASKRCPQEFQVTEDLTAWAAGHFPHVDLDAETEKFRDHEFAKAHTDWPATWRNWIRKASEFNGKASGYEDPYFAGRNQC